MAKLISIVGNSGAGKSTVTNHLCDLLPEKGFQVRNFLEPAPLYDHIKAYREQDKEDRNQLTEAALFTAAGWITFSKDIRPFLDKPNVALIADRNYFDRVVYQGIIGGVPLGTLAEMNSFVPKYDITLALTVDGQTGYERLLIRKGETGKPLSKSENPEDINKLADAYRQLPKLFPDHNIKVIDTTELTKDQLVEVCWSLVEKIL